MLTKIRIFVFALPIACMPLLLALPGDRRTDARTICSKLHFSANSKATDQNESKEETKNGKKQCSDKTYRIQINIILKHQIKEHSKHGDSYLISYLLDQDGIDIWRACRLGSVIIILHRTYTSHAIIRHGVG